MSRLVERLRVLGARGAWYSGSVWALVVAGAILVLGLARVLEPAVAGHGTHVQLGLAPCTVLAVTGVPCPSCGLTTSFAHLARLEVLDAVAANAAGLPFFAVVASLVPLGLVAMARRMPVVDTLAALRVDVVAFALVGATFVTWGVRLLAALLS
jgi:hypothetical protein